MDQSKLRRKKSWLRHPRNKKWSASLVVLFLLILLYGYFNSQSVLLEDKNDSDPIVHDDDHNNDGERLENVDNLRGGDDVVPASTNKEKLNQPKTSENIKNHLEAETLGISEKKPTSFKPKKVTGKREKVAQIKLQKKTESQKEEEKKRMEIEQKQRKQTFDDGFKGSGLGDSGLPPMDFGTDENGGPDGVRAFGKHPHYMAKCHSCYHHKFMYVALEGNHEPEIVKNLGIVMCKMQGNAPDCGSHFIEHDCSPFTSLDRKDWFIFTFTMNPHSRAVSSWTLGLEHDIKKAGIRRSDWNNNLIREERLCSFRRWVLWAGGMDGGAGMSCPFKQPSLQVDAIYTEGGLPALNYVGRIENYQRDIVSILQLIDPSGSMVKYHKDHAKEFSLHPQHHPENWKSWYKDYQTPKLWPLISRVYKADVDKLGYLDTIPG